MTDYILRLFLAPFALAWNAIICLTIAILFFFWWGFLLGSIIGVLIAIFIMPWQFFLLPIFLRRYIAPVWPKIESTTPENINHKYYDQNQEPEEEQEKKEQAAIPMWAFVLIWMGAFCFLGLLD